MNNHENNIYYHESCCGGGHTHNHADQDSCCGSKHSAADGTDGCHSHSHSHDGSCCGGGHDHDACCDHDHDQLSVTLTLEDDSEIVCPVIDIFDINGQQYIALLHPIDQNALLYRFNENDNDTINIAAIEDEKEFDFVSKTFLAKFED